MIQRPTACAEVTVKSVKNQLRRILLHAGVDSFMVALGTSIPERDLQVPKAWIRSQSSPLSSRSLVRRRRWKKQAFEPMVEVARYLGSAPEDNGHWIKVNDEAPRVTRCYMQKAIERPEEGVWLAIEREVLDALTKRRRL